MGVLVVLVLLVLAGWVLFTQIGARQQITVSTKHDLASARRIVSESFGVTWTRVKGRGNENFRPKLRMHAPVLSVDYSTDENGKCSVHIWCSDYKTKVGAMAHAQLMWRKKRAVAQALNPPVPVTPASPSPVPASPASPSPVPASPALVSPASVQPGPERAPGRHAHAAHSTAESKHRRAVVPPSVIGRLAAYGQAAIDARRLSQPVTDPRFDWDNFVGFVHMAMLGADRDQVIAELYQARTVLSKSPCLRTTVIT
jgi:hypothetical protein